MKIYETRSFRKQYNALPQRLRKKYQKQIKFLTQNFYHSSLNTKKYKSKENIWEARIDRHNRFIFEKENNSITLLAIGPHDEVLGK